MYRPIMLYVKNVCNLFKLPSAFIYLFLIFCLGLLEFDKDPAKIENALL